MYIYKITCIPSGKIYIGQHAGKSLKSYLNHNIHHAVKLNYTNKTHLFNAMRKYVPIHGKECFQIEPIIYLDSSIEKSRARELLNRLEIVFIREFNARNDAVGYNVTAGGGGQLGRSYACSEAHKAKISQLMRGRQITWADKISAAQKGRKFSEEHKRKLAEGQRGKPKSPRSAEHRRKISEHKRRWWAEASSERKNSIISALWAGQKEANGTP